MAMLYRYVNKLSAIMKSPAAKGKKICHWSGTHSFLRANSVYLMVAFMVVKMGMSPTEACEAVPSITPALTPFRDASYVVCSLILIYNRSFRPPALQSSSRTAAY